MNIQIAQKIGNLGGIPDFTRFLLMHNRRMPRLPTKSVDNAAVSAGKKGSLKNAFQAASQASQSGDISARLTSRQNAINTAD